MSAPAAPLSCIQGSSETSPVSISGKPETSPRALLTVRPGPVVHVWREGAEVAAVSLSPAEAVAHASAVLAAVRLEGGGDGA